MDLETILKNPTDTFQYRIGSAAKGRSKQRECREKRGEVGFHLLGLVDKARRRQTMTTGARHQTPKYISHVCLPAPAIHQQPQFPLQSQDEGHNSCASHSGYGVSSIVA
jgi:hypothetical protein